VIMLLHSLNLLKAPTRPVDALL